MQIWVYCAKCFQEKDLLENPNNFIVPTFPAVLEDSGLYRLECPNGHVSYVSLQQQKFELLFDYAANAIIDGYYREAVSSFTACLERFYEFYVQVICLKNKVRQEVFQKTWKICSSRSERELGAFTILYLIENKEKPPLLPDKLTRFRNEVIHKGKFPSKCETIKFGESILALIRPILEGLKKNEAESVSTAVHWHVRKIREQLKYETDASFMSIATTISITKELKGSSENLKDALVRIEKRRHFEKHWHNDC